MVQSMSLLSDIKEILTKYIEKNNVEKFYAKLEGKPVSKENNILDDLFQIEAEISEGSDKRAQIDMVITFVEENLEGEKLSQFLLQLGRLMIDNGELDIAEEINKDLISQPSQNDLLDSTKANAYLSLAKINWQQGIWDEALKYTRKAYYIFTNLSDNIGCAKCENMFGTIYGERGEIAKAAAHFERGKAYLYNNQDPETQAMFETNLGILYNMQGDYPKALKNFRNSLRIYKKLRNTKLIARVTHNMGMVKTKMKNYEGALEDFNKSINVSLKHNYLSNCAISYIAKAYIYSQTERPELAEIFTDKAMEIAYKLNDTLTIADIYRVKGLIQKNLGNLDFAEELLENSIRLNKDKMNKVNEAEASEELAEIYKEADKTEDAKTHIKKALSYYKKIKAESLAENIKQSLQNISPATA